MIMEKQEVDGHEKDNNLPEKQTLREESVEFYTLEEESLSGTKLTDQKQARFEELKKIRSARDKKYLVNQEPEPFTHESKQRLTN